MKEYLRPMTKEELLKDVDCSKITEDMLYAMYMIGVLDGAVRHTDLSIPKEKNK